jgi:hypothetical protein
MILSGTKNGEMTEVAISVAPSGSVDRRAWVDRQDHQGHTDSKRRLDQAVAQLNEVLDKRLLCTSEFVVFGWVLGHKSGVT